MTAFRAFNKILVANRGEIACRVIDTARKLGYRTVAVFSEADRNARHVTMADQAVCIGPATATHSYLNIDAILDAAQKTGADAIHPGYGFLSENADFARACDVANITFIGPPVDAIHLMGSKRLSKLAMQDAGVPCIPGYQGEDQSDAALLKAAERIGLPLMIKASAGGGGRGMRMLDSLDTLPEQLRSARNEAKNAFGSDELILERAVRRPRHVEIQIFGDHHGNIIHLGERDCSVQRRHQKVVEESPSPAVSPTLRERMGEAAIQAARACQYVGAGTVEFLLAEDGHFYFLEMNTRLQVEHPVTEQVTGLDLVAWQIRVARGEALPLTQQQVTLNGHAIEVRLYAEAPEEHFLPQTGTVAAWRPATGEGVRIDHGLNEGFSVGSHYDPMLAKIIAWGENREDARRRLIRAVEDTVLFGVRDNRRFLAAILRHPVFANGSATTAFLAEEFSADTSLQPTPIPPEAWSLAAALFSRGSAAPQHWHSSSIGRQLVTLACGDTRRTVSPDTLKVQIPPGETSAIAHVDGIQQTLTFRQAGQQLWLHWQGNTFAFTDITHHPANIDGGTASGQIRAPMDGAVVAIHCQAGQKVAKGEILVVMEAMKMEHNLKATADGVVEDIRINPGEHVRGRQILLTVAF